MKTKSKYIVLLHGWGASAAKLEPLAASLHARGWDTKLTKLPGFDLLPPAVPWDLSDYARFVSEKTKNLTSFVLFGHSFGGAIALKLASQNPDNLSGLVLCGARGLSRGSGIRRMVFLALAKTGKTLMGKQPLFKKLLYRLAGEHDYEKASGVKKEILRNVIGEDLRPLAGDIRRPTLILWGSMDRITPAADARFLKRAIPSAELVTYPTQGHLLPYGKPEEMAKVIDTWYATWK